MSDTYKYIMRPQSYSTMLGDVAKQSAAKTAFFRKRPNTPKRDLSFQNSVIDKTNKQVYGDAAKYIKPVSAKEANRDYINAKRDYNNYWNSVRARQKLDEEEQNEIDKIRIDTFGENAKSDMWKGLSSLIYDVKNIYNDVMANKSSGGAESLESDNRDLLTKQALKDEFAQYLKIQQQFNLLKEALPQTTGKQREETEKQLYEYQQYLNNPDNFQKIADFANARNREYGFWGELGRSFSEGLGQGLGKMIGLSNKDISNYDANAIQKNRDASLIKSTVADLVSKGRDSIIDNKDESAYQADDYQLAIAGLDAETKDDKNKIRQNNKRAAELRMDEARYKANIPKVWTDKSQITQNESLFNPDYWLYCVPGTVGSSISSDNFWKAMAIKGTGGAIGAALGSTGGPAGMVGGAITGWNMGSMASAPFDFASGLDENKVEIQDKYLDNLASNLDLYTKDHVTGKNNTPLKNAILSDLQKQSMEYWHKQGMSDDYINENYNINNDTGVRNVLQDLSAGRTSNSSPILKQAAMASAIGLNAQYYSDNVVTMTDTAIDLWANYLPGGTGFKLVKGAAGKVGEKIANTAVGSAVKGAGQKAANKIKNHLFVSSEGRGVMMFDNPMSRAASQGATKSVKEAAETGFVNSFKNGYNTVGDAVSELGFGMAGKVVAGTTAGATNAMIHAIRKALPERAQRFLDKLGESAINKYQGVLDKITPEGSWRRLCLRYGIKYAERRAVGGIAEGVEEGNQYQFSKKDFSKYRYGLPSLSDLLLGHTEATINAFKAGGSLFGICDSELKDDIEFWNNTKGGMALGLVNANAFIQGGAYAREAYQQHQVTKALQNELIKNREDGKMARRSNQAIASLAAQGKGDAVIQSIQSQYDNDKRRSEDQRIASDEQWEEKLRTANEINSLVENDQLTNKLEAKGIRKGSVQYQAAIADYFDSRSQIKQNTDDINDIDQRIRQNSNTKYIIDYITASVENQVEQEQQQQNSKMSDENRKNAVNNRVRETVAINSLYNQLHGLLMLKAKTQTLKGFFGTLKRRGISAIQNHNMALKLLDKQIAEVKSQINDLFNTGITDESDRFDRFEGMSDMQIVNEIRNSFGFVNNGDVQELIQQKALLQLSNQQHLMHLDQFNYGLVERQDDSSNVIKRIKNRYSTPKYEYNPEEYEQRRKDNQRESEIAREYSKSERKLQAKINSKKFEISQLREKDSDDAELQIDKLNAELADLNLQLDKERENARDNKELIHSRERLTSTRKSENDRYVQRLNKILEAQQNNDAIDWMVQDITEGKAGSKIDDLYYDEYMRSQEEQIKSDQTTVTDRLRYESGIQEYESKEEADIKKQEIEAARKKREEKLKQNGDKWNRRRKRVVEQTAKRLNRVANKYSGTLNSSFGLTPEMLENTAIKLMANGTLAVYKIGNFIDDIRDIVSIAAGQKGLTSSDIDNIIKESTNNIVYAYRKAVVKAALAYQLIGKSTEGVFSTQEELDNILQQKPDERQTLKEQQKWTDAQLQIRKKFEQSQVAINREKSDFYTTYVTESGNDVAYRNVIWTALGNEEAGNSASLHNAKVVRSAILNYLLTGDTNYIENAILKDEDGNPSYLKRLAGYDQFLNHVTKIYNSIQNQGYMPLDVNLNVYGKINDGSNVSSQADIVLIDSEGKAVIYNILTSFYSDIMNTGLQSHDLGTTKNLVDRAISEMYPVLQIFQNKFNVPVKSCIIIPISVQPKASINIETNNGNAYFVTIDQINKFYNQTEQQIRNELSYVITKYNDYATAYNYSHGESKADLINSDSYDLTQPISQIVDQIVSIKQKIDTILEMMAKQQPHKQEQKTKEQHIPNDNDIEYTEQEQEFISAVQTLDSMITNEVDAGIVDDNFILQTVACQSKLYQLLLNKNSSIDRIQNAHDVVVRAIQEIAKNSQNYTNCAKAIQDFVNISQFINSSQLSLQSVDYINVMIKTFNLWNGVFNTFLDQKNRIEDIGTQQWYSSLANNFIKPLVEESIQFVDDNEYLDSVQKQLFKTVIDKTQQAIDQFNQIYKVAPSQLINSDEVTRVNSMSTMTRHVTSGVSTTKCQPSLTSLGQKSFAEISKQPDLIANSKLSFRLDNTGNPIMTIEYNGRTVDLNFVQNPSKSGSNFHERFNAYSKPFRVKLSKMIQICNQDPSYHIVAQIQKQRCSFNIGNTVNNVSQFLFNSNGNQHNLFTITVSDKDRIGTLKDSKQPFSIRDTSGHVIGTYVDPDTGILPRSIPTGQLFYMYDDGRNEQHGKYTPVQLTVQSFGQLGITQNLIDLIKLRSQGETEINGFNINDLIAMVMFVPDASKNQVVDNAIKFIQPGIVAIGSKQYNLYGNDYNAFVNKINSLRVCENISLLNQNLNSSSNSVFRKLSEIFANSSNESITLPNGLTFTSEDFMHKENGRIVGSTYLGYLLRNNLIGTNITSVKDTYIQVSNIKLEKKDKDPKEDIKGQIDEANSKQTFESKTKSLAGNIMDMINRNRGLFNVVSQKDLVNRSEDDAIEFENRMRQIIGDMLGDGDAKNLRFFDNQSLQGVTYNANVAGVCHSAYIELSTAAPESTAYHEAFHKILELTMPPADRERLYQAYRDKYKNTNLSTRDIAEGLADLFTEYVQRNVINMKKSKWFSYFYNWCKKTWFNTMMSFKFGNTWKQFTQVYSQALRGDFKDGKIIKENIERFQNEFEDKLYYEFNDKQSHTTTEYNCISNVSEAREVAKSLAFFVIKSYGLDTINPSGTKIEINESTPNRFNVISHNLLSYLRADGVDYINKTDAQRAYAEILEEKIETIEENGRKRQVVTYPKFKPLIPLINQYISSISNGFEGKLKDAEDEQDSDVDRAVKDNIDKFGKMSCEFNPLDRVGDRVKMFFGTLQKLQFDDEEGVYKRIINNRLATPELYDINEVFTSLTSELHDITSIEDLTKKLEDMQDQDGMHRQVYRKWKQLCDYIVKNPNDNDSIQLQIAIAKSLKCHINTYVYCYSKRDAQGNLISEIKNTEYDRDTVFAPRHWLDNLYNGNTGIFSTVKDSNGQIVVADDIVPQILQNISQILNTIRSQIAIASSITANDSFVHLGANAIDVNNPTDLSQLKTVIISLLNKIGIPITIEHLNYMLNQKYGNNSAEALSMWMNSNGYDSMTPFLNILNGLINDNGVLNNQLSRDGYVNSGFVKELANWIGKYNRSKQTSSRLGFDSKRYYQVSQNFAISQISDMINNHDENDDLFKALYNSKYTINIGQNGLPIGSILGKAIFNNRDFKIKLLTDIGSKTDRRGDQGNTYTNRTEQDDFITKYTALRRGYILFPTLADKSGYVMIDLDNKGNSEISIPGLVIESSLDSNGNRTQTVKNAPKIGFNVNIGNYLIPDDRVLTQMIEYAKTEKARILEIMQECGYEDRDKIDGYEDNPNVKFIPKEYRVKNIHSENGMKFQSLRDLVLEDGVTTISLCDDKKPYELMNLANKYFFNQPLEKQKQIMTMILARANRNIINKSLELGIVKIGNDENGAGKLNIPKRSILDNLANVALDNQEVSTLADYFFNNTKSFVNEQDLDKRLAKRNLCRSLAIAALLGDAQNRHIISTQEVQRWYIGNPASFKNDADIQKRMGSLMSTGEDNLMYDGAPKYYNCAEISDYVIPLSDSDRNDFHNRFLNGELRETLANILISKADSKDSKTIKSIYDRVYSKEFTIDQIREEFKSLGEDAVKKMKQAEERAKNFVKPYDEINVADGQSYMSDRMCEQLLRFNGAWVGEVPRAFELIRKDGLTEREYYEAYRVIQGAVNIVTVKYTAYGTRIHPITGEPITYLNKFAIAPIFKNIATGKMADICQYMTDHEIDNLLFDSAVKVGSCNPAKFDGEKFDHELTIYQQPYANLRKQMNTDPEEGDEMHIGTQMVKIVLSNLIKARTYKDSFNNDITGEQILNDMMESIDKLREFGEKEFLDQFMSNGVVDEAKTSQWLTEQMGSRNATEQLVSALSLKRGTDGVMRQTMPIAATASSKWIESIIISNANKHIVDIMTPGTSFVQRSVFAMEDDNRKDGEGRIESADSYNGQELKMINNKRSMDAVVSLDYFKDIIPKSIKTFKEAREWLIKNKIIGIDAEANTIGYRIPTQAESSIHAIRILDVIDDVKGTIILPKAFTTVTGSDFDIDHLYLQRLNFKVGENGEVIQDAYNQNDKEFYQNKLLNTMMTLLLDSDNSMHLLFKSIDNDTKLAHDCANQIKQDASTAKQAYNFNTLSEQITRKNIFISGKFGIGPYALNLTMQTLLEQFNLKLKPNSLPAKIGRGLIGRHFTDEGDTVLAWLSAFINGNVDNVKDPWVARLNSNTTTFNMINFLLKLGYGKNAVWFCAQPILKKYAEFESVRNCKLLQDPQNFKSQDKMLDEFLQKNAGISLKQLEQEVESITRGKPYFVKNTIENRLLQAAATGDKSLSNTELKKLQKNVIITWFAMSQYAQQLSQLIQFSKIDTRKEGKTFSQLLAYKYGYQTLYDDNFDGEQTSKQRDANAKLMFNYDDLKALKDGTWIGNKTQTVIKSIFESMKHQTFIANSDFRRQIIRMAEYVSLNDSGTISAQLIDSLTTGAISQIKFQWAYRFANQFDDLFFGETSVANMLDDLKYRILNNDTYKVNGKVRSYGELKDNELLNRLRKNYDNDSDNQNLPNFVILTRSFDDSKIDTDRVIEDWEQLLESDCLFAREFARRLVAYAMLTSEEYTGRNKLAKYIPSRFLSGEIEDSKVDGLSFAEFIQDQLQNGVMNINIDTIVQNQINDSNLVKSKNEKDFEIKEVNGNVYARRRVVTKEKENLPIYISLPSKDLSITNRKQRDLYKLNRIVFNGTNEYPVYVKIDSLGYHENGFDVYDYIPTIIDAQDDLNDVFDIDNVQDEDDNKIIIYNNKILTREQIAEDKENLYIFTDNAYNRSSGFKNKVDKNSWYYKKYSNGRDLYYPNKTQAIARGLDNAFPISTQHYYDPATGRTREAGRWQDSDFDEFVQVIDSEFKDILEAYKSGKYKHIIFIGGDGLFNSEISNISEDRTPKLYHYLKSSLKRLEDAVNELQHNKSDDNVDHVEHNDKVDYTEQGDGYISFTKYGPHFRLSSDRRVIEYTNAGDVMIRGNNGKSIQMTSSNFQSFIDIIDEWFGKEIMNKEDNFSKSIAYSKDMNKNVNELLEGIGDYNGENMYDYKSQFVKYNKSNRTVTITNSAMYKLYKFAQSSMYQKINKLVMNDINGFNSTSTADRLYAILEGNNVDTSDSDKIRSIETGNDLFGENDVDLLSKQLGIDKQSLMKALEEGAKKRKNCKGK